MVKKWKGGAWKWRCVHHAQAAGTLKRRVTDWWTFCFQWIADYGRQGCSSSMQQLGTIIKESSPPSKGNIRGSKYKTHTQLSFYIQTTVYQSVMSTCKGGFPYGQALVANANTHHFTANTNARPFIPSTTQLCYFSLWLTFYLWKFLYLSWHCSCEKSSGAGLSQMEQSQELYLRHLG